MKKRLNSLYQVVFKRPIIYMRIALIRTKLWLEGVTFGKWFIAEGNVSVGN